ncbi:MAG: HD domain-containing protein, partial [Desulfobacula sp.]|nr:HD domain-containing protein [Desulfobacula sp.]
SYTLEKVSERARLIRENREYKESLEIKVKERTSELNKANVSLRHLQMQIILRLARAGEYRDNETGRHVIRVSKYAEVISKKLGLLPEKVELIKRTSSLHDIGKIGVPDNILLKPGKLDEKEWEIMKEHCRYGYNILSVNEEKPDQMENDLSASLKIPENFKLTGELLDCACNIALYHHEKWDGSGYLLGLKCDKIPLEARITALADVYDALGSSRTYKKPFSEEKCQSIVRELSGSHFDPKIVAVFFESIETIKDIKTRWKD